ncbi:hypothetical protein [Mesoplasma melaleucae]|uniref:Uncharacterized protein n=1 Tax=Mesoplasma melaleucae TaxID=81459 RepID=A0A2K8NWH1_9MOLU|nr:hypothetical protein [Mesoplasma melaleucae]ATZ17896.1 hypothetical protein EMELA_v1c03260 [Mesoplasma melaleucae]
MDKQLSRSEIHKEHVEEINKKFSNNKANLSLNAFVISSLESLKRIDNDFFSKVEKILNQENDNVNFHLEHDPEIRHFNYEILSQLNDSLLELKKIQDYELTNNGQQNKNNEIVFNEKEYYRKELEDLLNELVEKNRNYLNKVNNSEAYKTDYAGEHGETLAKSFLSKDEKIAIHNETKKYKFNELSFKIKAKQREKMHDLSQSKKRFKINTKLFSIAFITFMVLGIIGLIIIFVI